MKMKVLTVANRKGGAGKSTCAAHLAVEAANAGYKIILIDLDPQQTLEGWWNKREKDDIDLMEVKSLNLSDQISKLSSSGFDLCIVDTPGDASENAKAGINIADLVVIPSKPTAPDLSAIGRTISMVEEAGKKFVFVITQGMVNTNLGFQASSALSGFGKVAPAIIANRASYARAMGCGDSASSEDKKAAEEISKVWDFVKENIFETSAFKHKKKLIA
jgi:chromosome partitioning protein